MIISSESLSMAEVSEYVKKDEENKTEIIGFIKKFISLKAKDAKELKQEIESLGLVKIRPEYATKIADLLPENIDELNKIFVEVSLDDDEAKKILETIKKFK